MKRYLSRLLIALLMTGISSSAFALTLATQNLSANPTLQKSATVTTLNELYAYKAASVCWGLFKAAPADTDCHDAIHACEEKYLGICSGVSPFETCTAVNFDATFAMALSNVQNACGN